MTAASIPSPAPASTDDLRCPLCQYSLRGLIEPRCPECGFAFQWQELIDAEKNRHPYLFEHQSRRNLWSLWKTFWRDCRPRRFWRELSPAQRIHPRRLMVYWVLSNLTILIMLLVPLAGAARRQAVANNIYRQPYIPTNNGSLYQWRMPTNFSGQMRPTPITAA